MVIKQINRRLTKHQEGAANLLAGMKHRWHIRKGISAHAWLRSLLRRPSRDQKQYQNGCPQRFVYLLTLQIGGFRHFPDSVHRQSRQNVQEGFAGS